VARTLADHAAVISDGTIVAEGEASELFGSEEPLVRQLVSGARSGPLSLSG
jgi:ABC-type transporter Mla maintaining outer membrane lipid asymmetry ATPase subunit MlaF